MKRTGWSKRKKATITLLSLAIVGLGIFGFGKAQAGTPRDCSNNSIIKCGVQSSGEFISRVRSNNPGDLQSLFAAFGLSANDYDSFANHARMGTVYKNGNIVVDGQTVATGAWSLGRENFSGRTKVTIGGRTYYQSPTSVSFRSQTIPVLVLFNTKGEMQVGMLTPCGNPTWGHKITPMYSCDMLNKTAVEGKLNTFAFTTKATASNNATITKVVYDFGDGTTATSNDPTAPVEHRYARSGTYIASVKVYVKLPGNQEVEVTSATCQTEVVVAPPFQQCLSLNAYVVDRQKRQFRFTVTTNQGNGSTLKSASFNFGDGTSSDDIDATDANTVVTEHKYEKEGKYTISATVNFDTYEGVKSVTCKTPITIAPNMCPINPSVPIDSPKCKPCKYNDKLPVGSPACLPPKTNLPNTGPGSTIALFAGAVIVGFAGYRYFTVRRLKRGL